MNKFKLKIADSAKRQITEQVLHISDNSYDKAIAWERRLIEEMKRIAEVHADPVDEDASERSEEVIHKHVFERTFLIHYRINDIDKWIEIMNVRHGARLPRHGEP